MSFTCLLICAKVSIWPLFCSSRTTHVWHGGLERGLSCYRVWLWVEGRAGIGAFLEVVVVAGRSFGLSRRGDVQANERAGVK
jgi:hypothetical protein